MIIVWKIVLVIQTMGQSKCVISESSGPARYTCVRLMVQDPIDAIGDARKGANCLRTILKSSKLYWSMYHM